MSLIKSTKAEKSTYKLEFSVDKATFDKAVSNVYRKQVGKIAVPGFRKGKAPPSSWADLPLGMPGHSRQRHAPSPFPLSTLSVLI